MFTVLTGQVDGVQILLTDETNQQPSKSVRFVVYGGLYFPIEKLSQLCSDIERIRKELGYVAGDSLKFEPGSIPTRLKGIEQEKIWKARHDVVAACASVGAKFVACICHHSIAAGAKSGGNYIAWPANETLKLFHDHLVNTNDTGICIFDNLPIPKPYAYLAEKRQKGLVYVGKPNRPLTRILAFSQSCVDACHANSAVDIVLGLFRTCINAPKQESVARTLMSDVARLLKHVKTSKGQVIFTGLTRRPMSLNRKFEPDYTWLNQQLQGLISGGPIPGPLPPVEA